MVDECGEELAKVHAELARAAAQICFHVNVGEEAEAGRIIQEWTNTRSKGEVDALDATCTALVAICRAVFAEELEAFLAHVERQKRAEWN